MSKVRLPFGVYARRDLAMTPTDYLCWTLQAYKLTSRLRAAIRAELSSRPDCPPLPPEPPPKHHVCFRCGEGAGLLVYWVHSEDRRVIRCECRKCARFIAHLPQTAENGAKAAQDRDAALKAARRGGNKPNEEGRPK